MDSAAAATATFFSRPRLNYQLHTTNYYIGIRGEVGHGVKWDNYEYFWGKIHCAKTIRSIYFFLVLLEAQEHLLNTY